MLQVRGVSNIGGQSPVQGRKLYQGTDLFEPAGEQ